MNTAAVACTHSTGDVKKCVQGKWEETFEHDSDTK
jgi:hypothetical protein